MSKDFDPRIHVGETHGIYTITDMLDEKDKYGHWIYEGTCNVCGHVKYSTYGGFKRTKLSTKCTHVRADGIHKVQHGIKWSNKRLQKIFNDMIARCYNVNHNDFRFYGNKGVKVCRKWIENPKSFEEWALSNGYADTLTIDRKNSNKDYEPDNCRWITAQDNAKYKSTTNLIDIDGEIHTGTDWSKILGLGVNVINTYIRKYTIDNVKEFIRRYLKNPGLKPYRKNQSIYDLYMN